MAKKIFTYKGKTLEELQAMSTQELMKLVPATARRKLKRGFTDTEKITLAKLAKKKNNVETHCRDIVVLPSMVGLTIKIHQGKEFFPVLIQEEMIGHRLGEFAQSRRRVAHSAPGVGATKSSSALSVR